MLAKNYDILKVATKENAFKSSPENLEERIKANAESTKLAIERLNGFHVKFENLSPEELEHINASFEDVVYFGTMYKVEESVLKSDAYKVIWGIC